MSRLRVCFLHPDLGLGGAERLVVDAAAGLASRGHAVAVFTNHFDRGRCFAEARDGAGGFRVRVAGAWIPRTLPLLGLHMLLAVLQNAWLALCAAVVALRARHGGGAADDDFDVFVCDQVSVCVPLLRLLLPRAAVVFYCHFPDLLLAPRRSLSQRLYRAPFDLLEEATTGLADAVVVNSRFTRDTFCATFQRLGFIRPAVLYPCISLEGGDVGKVEAVPVAGEGASRPIVLLSINRFERKKGIATAIRAMGLLRELLAPAAFARVHLVVAGGYDTRVAENVEHHRELLELVAAEGLLADSDAGAIPGTGAGPVDGRGKHARLLARRRGSVVEASAAAATPSSSSSADFVGWRTSLEDVRRVIARWPDLPSGAAPASFDQCQVGAHVTFIRSFSDVQKRVLLARCAAVIYTPPNEHFGIVPLECMAASRPVVACSSGGPLESVVHGVTGLLCEPKPSAFASAMAQIVADPVAAVAMGRAGRAHVASSFSRVAFGQKLEAVAVEARRNLWAGRAAHARGRARLWAILAAMLAAGAGLVGAALAALFAAAQARL